MQRTWNVILMNCHCYNISMVVKFEHGWPKNYLVAKNIFFQKISVNKINLRRKHLMKAQLIQLN